MGYIHSTDGCRVPGGPLSNTRTMNKLLHNCCSVILVIVLLCGFLPAKSQTLMPVNPGSKVTFKVENHVLIGGGTVTGTLENFTGNIVFNPNRIREASFDVSVRIGSISTGIGLRDRHLKKNEYFNEPKYPVARIRSTEVVQSSKAGVWLLRGQLTLKGVSRSIELPFTAKPQGKGWLFQGQLNLNRRDYNVGPDNSIDDNVNVSISVKAL